MKRRDGFTLVEILVVIGIMALLASLMMGGLSAAKSKARKTQARTEVAQIATAWKVYYVDYKHFPIDGTGNAYSIDDVMGEKAIRILQGNYSGAPWSDMNPRNTAYLDFHAETTEQSGYAGYLDPWGNVYQVRLDEDYDGYVSVPKKDGTGNEDIRFSVAAWSMGPDEADGTADDIRSWDKR